MQPLAFCRQPLYWRTFQTKRACASKPGEFVPLALAVALAVAAACARGGKGRERERGGRKGERRRAIGEG